MQATNLLEQLKNYTTIVADTGDLKAIEKFRPLDATTNPSLITKALASDAHKQLIKSTLQANNNNINNSIDSLTIEIGKQILALIEGRVSTEIDANLAFDTQKTIENAKQYIDAYAKAGIDANRVLIKIPATWQGIKAGEELQKIGINCNLTLIFDLHQAQACADAGIKLISPFVGRILDWQKATENRQDISIDEDKGVNSVKRIYQYYKQHGYETQIMGASFRNIEQICALAGCDFLTIAPELLDKLAQTTGELVPALIKNMNFENMPKQVLNATDYALLEEKSQVTKDLLTKGINGFIQARDELAQNLSSFK